MPVPTSAPAKKGLNCNLSGPAPGTYVTANEVGPDVCALSLGNHLLEKNVRCGVVQDGICTLDNPMCLTVVRGGREVNPENK